MFIVANTADDSLIKDTAYFKIQGLYNIDFTPYRFYNIGKKIYFEFFTKPYDIHINPADKKGVMFDTCARYISGAYADMFANSKISAYGNKEKTVNCFNRGYYVFYYKNGIIGVGIIDSDTTKDPNPNKTESFRKVELLTPVLKSGADIRRIRYGEIIDILGLGRRFCVRGIITKNYFLSVKESEGGGNCNTYPYGVPTNKIFPRFHAIRFGKERLGCVVGAIIGSAIKWFHI